MVREIAFPLLLAGAAFLLWSLFPGLRPAVQAFIVACAAICVALAFGMLSARAARRRQARQPAARA